MKHISTSIYVCTSAKIHCPLKKMCDWQTFILHKAFVLYDIHTTFFFINTTMSPPVFLFHSVLCLFAI